MAGSSYRPFRHVATLAALCVQTAVVGIRARISVELQTTHRQLETEAKRGSSSSRRGGGGSGKQQQQLRDRVAQLSQQDEVAEAAFKAFYDTVFIYRYRDVQATIRSECIVPLATWCRAFPAAYLDTEYLRYLGWALNDKDARVRETALAAIGGPLLLGKQPVHGGVGSGVGGCGGIAGTAAAAAASSEDSVAEGIRPFIGRFLPRIVQVAAGDIDVKVQVAALKLVALLGKHQYLDPTAKIGDIRSIKKSGQKVQKKKKKPKKKTLLSRGSYSNSLSQQLLEESSSEEEEEEEDEEEAATAAGGGGVIEIQTLYELNAEDEEEEEAGQLRCPRHTTMRFLAPLVTHAQAAVRGAAAELVAWWVREDWARAARVAALGLGHAHDEHEDEDEGEGGDESEDEDDDASAEDLLRTAGGRRRVQRWAVFKAVAAFLAQLARGDQQAEADGDFGGADDDDDDDDSGGPARLLAAAAALWGRVAELGSLAALAAFLGRDHSQQRRRAFALAAREETALLQAFAAWVQEPGDHPRAARKATPGGRSSAAAAAAAAGSKGWQAALPRLLARNGDSAARTAALAGAAAAALDVQALFDADRGACVEAVAQHLSAALQRHAACARVVRPAAAFLARVDGSAVLRERWCLLAAVQAAGATRVVALRALLRVADVASAVRVGDLLALAQEAATAEGVALAALDAALHAVLWRAAGALTGAEGLRTDPDVEGLRADAAALLASCEALADAAHGGRPRLAELAFVALGRVLRVLTGGPLARAHAALAAVVDAAAAARIRQRLDAFFEQRMATLRFDAPAEYARACALAAAWAAWLGDQTLPPAHFPRLAAQTGAWRGTTAPAARRRVGFVALSAVDHIVQAAADALRPQLARERTRPAAVDALAASLRAAFEAPAQPPADAAVNAATLARFVAAALRTAEAPAAALAPAPVGAAWAAAHVSAIAYGLALAAAAADDSDAAWDARVAPWF
ncbi:cohesin complex subunit, partial [Coemansia sp. RSA 1836]